MAARGRARPSLQRRYSVIGGGASLALFVLLVIATGLNLVLAWVLAWAVPSFLLYGYDKAQAKRNGLRVPEISLLLVSAAGGFAGALAAMVLLRHKTTRLKFWLTGIASAVVFAGLLLVSLF